MTESNIALICARGGSKGLPRKNLKRLGNKTLIGHAIDVALKTPSINRVVVSTDCYEIANEANQCGAEVPFMRRAELATDTASEWDTWKDAVEWLLKNKIPCDAMVMLSPTAPLRSVENVEAAIQLFHAQPCDGVISVTKAHRNPHFNMVTVNKDGIAAIGIDNKKPLYRRQDAPTFYDITTVCYVMKPSYIINNVHLFDGVLRCNRIPEENAIDIDTPYDFMLAEAIMKWSELGKKGRKHDS